MSAEVIKYKVPVAVGTTAAVFKDIFHVYIFNEWHIAGFVFIAVFFDTLTGVWKAAKRKQINSNAYGKVIEKCVLYFVVLILAHILTNFTQEPGFSEHLRWVRYAVYFTLISREVLSSVENIEVIRPGTFPAWLITRLRNVEATGDPTKLTKRDNE